MNNGATLHMPQQVKSPHALLWGFLTLALLALVFSTSAHAQTQLPYVLVPATEEPEALQETEAAEPASPDDAATTTAHEGRFVIYVIRHAEKEEDHVDPGLTRDGYRRADGLAQLLRHAEIEAIYSTFYRRNVGTALPLARVSATPIEFYQASEYAPLVENLLRERRNALVVGHSNTVADIVNALGGEAQPLNEETDYGDVFQLVIDTRGDETDVVQIHLTAPLLMDERRR